MKARLLAWGVALLALAPSLARCDSIHSTIEPMNPPLLNLLATDQGRIRVGTEHLCAGAGDIRQTSDFMDLESHRFFHSADADQEHRRGWKNLECKHEGRLTHYRRDDDNVCRFGTTSDGDIQASISNLPTESNLQVGAPSSIGDPTIKGFGDQVYETPFSYNQDPTTYTPARIDVIPTSTAIGGLLTDCKRAPLPPTPTPESSTLLLFGTTLLVLIGAAKIRALIV